MRASVVGSTAEVASSSSSSRGRRTRARARATRWRWPPDSVAPRSPTTVSCAAGEVGRRSRRRRPGRGPASRCSAGQPRSTFSATVSAKRNASWNAVATSLAQLGDAAVDASVAAVEADRRRASGSSSPATSSSSVDLPEPVGPTTATVRPGSTVKRHVVEHREAGLVGEGEAVDLEAGAGGSAGRRDAAPATTAWRASAGSASTRWMRSWPTTDRGSSPST